MPPPDGRQRKRARRQSPPPPQEEDRLSDLPDDILVYILSLLPSTDDRLSTSALSRRRRHLWTVVPSLDFPYRDDHPRDPTTHLRTVSNLIRLYRAYAHERQPLRRFSAHIFGNPAPRQFGQMVPGWIRFAASRSIRELSLSFDESSDREPKLKWILRSARTLRVLQLQGCGLSRFPRRPQSEERFHCLETLVLRRVKVTEERLGALLDICPGLESLEISECGCLRSINVSSPRLRNLVIDFRNCYLVSLVVDLPELRCFRFSGVVREVQWKVLPRLLLEAALEIRDPCHPSVWSHFHEAFSVVEFLSASLAFFQFRSVIISKENLRVLHCMKLECDKNFLPFLSYLSECPCLEELYVTLDHGCHDHQHGDYNMNSTSNAFYKWNWNFATKKIVITGFINTKPAVVFVKYLLSRTQLLEQLTIAYDTKCSSCVHKIKEEALKEIRDCNMASARVRIMITSSEPCPSIFVKKKF